MKNIDVLSTEHAIVSNLMNYPKLLKVKTQTCNVYRCYCAKFIEYVLEQGKVDVNDIYYKSREDAEFIPTKVLTQLYNSKGTDKVFLWRSTKYLKQLHFE